MIKSRLIVRAALIQAEANMEKQDALEKHVRMLSEAAEKGAQVACLQEIFCGPYFCAEPTEKKWFSHAEPDDGPTIRRMQNVAEVHKLVIVVPFFERDRSNDSYYNSAVVIDADGSVVGKYRKVHIPQSGPIFWERNFFEGGDLGYPAFDTAVGRIGIYICYDRHFPEGPRLLALAGADLLFNPVATIEGGYQHLWYLEQRSHAAANGVFVGTVNRIGYELEPGFRFHGESYFAGPRGEIIAQASHEHEEILIADLDLGVLDEVRSSAPFIQDRVPAAYGALATSVSKTAASRMRSPLARASI